MIVDLFGLDKSLCVKCGACVRDCAFKALKQDAEGWPTLPDPSQCMKCQHCFAICPRAAITFEGRRPEDSISTAGLALPKGEEVANWLRVRRSCRQFRTDRDVDIETIKEIMQALRNVPTGCNAGSLTFTCYPDRAAMNDFRARFLHTIERHREGNKLLPRWLAVPAIKLRRGGEDVFFRNASGMVIVTSNEQNPQVTTPNEDVTAACAYFEMVAQAYGLATCWCGFLRLIQREVPEILEETTGFRRTTPFYAMLFGLPAVRYPRGVQRESLATVVYKHVPQDC